MLGYIIGTSRQHLVNLTASMMPANYQQVPRNQDSSGYFSQVIAVLDHDPKKEAEFSHQKRGIPTMFAFHGTSADCMYSLQRNGLRNLSNSQYMTAGAAYGQGIYVAKDIGTARGYSRVCRKNITDTSLSRSDNVLEG